MTDNEYHQKLSNVKSVAERNSLNDEYLKSKINQNRIKHLVSYLKDNFLAIVAIIISIIALFK